MSTKLEAVKAALEEMVRQNETGEFFVRISEGGIVRVQKTKILF